MYTYTEPHFTWTRGSYRVGEECVSAVQSENDSVKFEKEISRPINLLVVLQHAAVFICGLVGVTVYSGCR